MANSSQPTAITSRLIESVDDRLERGLHVRRTLPGGGRLNIDRQLPFLVLYRPPEHDDVGTRRFARGQASYLIAPRGRRHRPGTEQLLIAVTARLAEVFGQFLVLEIWAGSDDDAELSPTGTAKPPRFRVVVPRRVALEPSTTRLVSELERTVVLKRRAEVELAPGGRLSPPGLGRAAPMFGRTDSPVHLIGLEIRPIYRSGPSDETYPVVLRALNRGVSRAISRAVFEFAVSETTDRPRHYQALGRRAFVQAVKQVDHQLSEIATQFDLLMAITPSNTEAALRAFKRSRQTKPPTFLYRPLSIEPGLLKRKLYSVPLERVEDPTLDMIFREKRRELALKLDLLSDRETPRFLPIGLALYGNIDAQSIATAHDVLDRLPSRRERRTNGHVPADTVVQLAQDQIDHYRAANPSIGATIEVRDDLTSLMVSNGHLLVGRNMSFAPDRVEPLIQHEVGTHVVTHWNGMAQPFQLLATGLAGYDELQEGLGVFAEYLVAGLTPARLRTLAARVLAADGVVNGAEFIDTFRLLHDDHGFGVRAAFLIATRVHRGGGLVKDAVYLRGLQQVVDYIHDGGRLDTLLVGKIAVEHAPVIEELQRREVLIPPPLRPTYLDDPDTHYRLERVRRGVELIDLAER